MFDDALTPADFTLFFQQVHGTTDRPGHAPFAWQTRLLHELTTSAADGGRDGAWPSLLDLPTGSGKTSTIEIAVFLMALRSDAPRRVVFVVDRRVVVQQAFVAAQRLSFRLAEAQEEDSVLGRVSRRLAALTQHAPAQAPSPPLRVVELRGAIELDESWTQRPDVPTVLTSTVDQVGSRLLMQGYGVSPRMRPVHAGLLANDVLFLLDEVHLSQPFADTLQAVRKLRRPGDAVWAGADRWQVTELSATPHRGTGGAARPFALLPGDRVGVLAQRLGAHKLTRTMTVPVRGDEQRESEQLARALADEALALHRAGKAVVIGVVANRVATASQVAQRLEAATGADATTRVVLLTGRMRPDDREMKLQTFGPRMRAGRQRSDTDEPLFVVGTQAVEAGADFDFDVLVTECASLDALRQRFGRVDRLGQVAASGRELKSVVVASARVGKEPDPIYGTALAATWEWLRGKGSVVDFGIDHLQLPPPDVLATLCVPARRAPALLTSHLDRWWQTPPPDAVPDVAHWLHGAERTTDPDVTVVWRLGITPAQDPESARDPESAQEVAVEYLRALPPHQGEGLAVPLSRVRRWLRGDATAAGFADVEGLPALERGAAPRHQPPPWLLWRPDGPVWSADPRSLRPGDVVVVDASRGGIAAGTWDSASMKAVSDLAVRPLSELDGESAAGHVVRLHPAVLGGSGMPQPPRTPDVEPPSDVELREAVGSWLAGAAARGPGAVGDPQDLAHAGWLAAHRTAAQLRVQQIGDGEHAWYLVRDRTPGRKGRIDPRPELSSALGQPVTLDQHLLDTAMWASCLVTSLRLDDAAAGAVIAAARWHDCGKVDPRFQRLLRSGQLEAGTELLAKSGVAPTNWHAWERARREAGYPRRERHEMYSVRLLQEGKLLDDDCSAELVSYLVGVHHGHGRPFVASAEGRDEPDLWMAGQVLGHDVELTGPHGMDVVDSSVPQRFWQVVRERGWFASVWLESLVRLADHRASEFPGSATEGVTS